MTRFYCISHNPDCTETGSPMARTYVRCDWGGHSMHKQIELVLEGWCEERFGSRVAYVQGVAPTQGWSIHEIDEKRWREAKPIRWGGIETKTVRAKLTLGNKRSGSPVKVLWEQLSKDVPILDDAIICPGCGHILMNMEPT